LPDEMIDKWILPAKLDAVIAYSDEWAVPLLKALKRRGIRVPDDVAVASIDNLDIARACEPELTSLDPQNSLLIKHVSKSVIELVKGNEPTLDQRTIVVKPKLIIRKST